MFFKIVNNKPVSYSVEKFRKDNPNIVFGENIPPKFMSEQNIVQVFPEQKPSITESQRLVLNSRPAQNEAGDWVLGWTVVNLTPEEQREWRNKELKETDWVVPVTDHPNRTQYLNYREALRNWPSTESFPATRPTIGDFPNE